MLTESERHELHTALEGAIGQRPASLMMDALGPMWNDGLARRSDIERLEAKIELQLARMIRANVITGFAIAAAVLAGAKLT